MNVNGIASQLGEGQSGFASSPHNAFSLANHCRLPGFLTVTKSRVMLLVVFCAFVGLLGDLNPSVGSVAVLAIAAGALNTMDHADVCEP
ncbi:hypothetical protein QA640_47820 (plasmid) [Bradyrhizobium sp. CB82]|uniref:hypothetical protein n=1 Tax=Bradyrhizobium sp. CB82 TaxID=3039159 RepID=UPI0024B25C05|nr:hypothetical protein [Bradyrhizobium sp. CB82]WFU45691.1 hypothetical protein QA640_47820 [Bradyrhizobium sp. CB82]